MSKVTSKLQVTIPKSVASDYAIRPGTEVFFEPAGEVIRVRVGREEDRGSTDDSEWALAIFDAATARQREREAAHPRPPTPAGATTRGWTREELYEDRVAR